MLSDALQDRRLVLRVVEVATSSGGGVLDVVLGQLDVIDDERRLDCAAWQAYWIELTHIVPQTSYASFICGPRVGGSLVDVGCDDRGQCADF